tara:strand:+ start:305 stop:421 length:117 start_codon:yes stop_codon:yes gene_type:complete
MKKVVRDKTRKIYQEIFWLKLIAFGGCFDERTKYQSKK